MKRNIRSGLYSASNVTFQPSTMNAYSYGWWRFVAKIDGLVIFNNYNYSNTTIKHQHKVKRLLASLGITIDIEASFPDGIGNDSLADIIEQAEEGLCNEFLKLEERKITIAEKSKARREAIKAKKDAEFKQNISSPEFDNAVISFIAKRNEKNI